jgi:hypothetical protein
MASSIWRNAAAAAGAGESAMFFAIYRWHAMAAVAWRLQYSVAEKHNESINLQLNQY